MKIWGGFYNIIIRLGDFLGSLLLLILRLYFGFKFFTAGWDKFHHIDKTAQFFEQLGIIWPLFNTYLVATVETFGGLCLLFGFASRLVAIPLIITMVVAYFTSHSNAVWAILNDPNQFFSQSPFLFLLTSLLVFCFGPGAFSLDQIITSTWCGKNKNY